MLLWLLAVVLAVVGVVELFTGHFLLAIALFVSRVPRRPGRLQHLPFPKA